MVGLGMKVNINKTGFTAYVVATIGNVAIIYSNTNPKFGNCLIIEHTITGKWLDCVPLDTPIEVIEALYDV